MIRLHHCPGTRSMRVLWLLHEIGAPFELVVHPFDKTLRSDAYRAIHPAGRVPAVEIDSDVIWESGAILQILCHRFPGAGLGREPNAPDWPDWLAWLHFAETISQHTAALTQQHVALYDDHMRSPIVMRLEAKRLEKCYGAIEGRLSTPVENRDHLLTAGFSAADVAVGQAVWMARHFARLDGFPETAAWFKRITDRDAFRAALPTDDQIRLYDREFYEAWDG